MGVFDPKSIGERTVNPALDSGEIEKNGTEWWDRYAEIHGSGWDGHCYRTSLAAFALNVIQRDGDEENVRRLAEYCLMFFDVADRLDCCQHLDAVATTFFPFQPGSAGRRWASSVMEVAWRRFLHPPGWIVVRVVGGALKSQPSL